MTDRAGARMHGTVDEHVQRIGVSRSVLGARFTNFPDQPPMRDVTQWRLQLVARQMKNAGVPLKSIVDSGGYEPEAAFSRAFKRPFGLPPRELAPAPAPMLNLRTTAAAHRPAGSHFG